MRKRAHARAQLERLDVTQPPSRTVIATRLAAAARPTYGGGSYREIVIALAALLEPPALLELILDEANDDAVAAVAADAERRRAEMQASPSFFMIRHPSEPRPAPEIFPAPLPDTPFAVLRAWSNPARWGESVSERTWLLHSLAAGYAMYVAPHLDDASAEHARAVVRPAIRRALAQTPLEGERGRRTESFSPACYLAAALGLTDEVEAIVAWWSDEIATARELPFLPLIVYGLRSADAVVAESRRLGLALTDPRALRDWLAATGEAGLDVACEQLAEHAAEATADAFVDEVAALDAPALPATMLRLTTVPVLYVSARTWIEANVDRALPALASARAGSSALAATADEILRRFARRGHPGAAAALAGEIVVRT